MYFPFIYAVPPYNNTCKAYKSNFGNAETEFKNSVFFVGYLLDEAKLLTFRLAD